MSASDWTYWDDPTSGASIRFTIHRYKGKIWYYDSARTIWTLDEDTLGNASSVVTFPMPTGASTGIGWSLWRMGQYFYASVYTIRTGAWGAGHIVIYRYDTISMTYSKVLDPYDGTGFSHGFDAVLGYNLVVNKVGFAIGVHVQDISEGWNLRGCVLCSYNGTDWFLGYIHPSDTGGPPTMRYTDYYCWDTTQVDKKAATDLTYWTDWSYAPPYPTTSYYGNKSMCQHPTNTDQWLISDDHWYSYNNFKDDTGLVTGLRQINTGGGYFWSCGNYGLAYYAPDSGWILDYPDITVANRNIIQLVEGYTGSLFFFSSAFAGGAGRIYKRTTKPGGLASAGATPHKLSVDRNSSMVYCTTHGIDTMATDYWSVTSDLATVTLIDKSEASGIYGGVHSAEANGVYCYGQIYGDLVKRSTNQGITFSGYGFPSGVVPYEASTLFSLRDNGLPDNLIITITMSGQDWDDIYTYSGIWLFLTSGNFIAESQVRQDTHSFLGALDPTGNIVDYSADSGVSWTNRDSGLPTITITDLDFA